VSGKSVVGTFEVQPGGTPPTPVPTPIPTPDGPPQNPPGKRLSLDLKPQVSTAKLATLLKSGLVVKPGCAVACGSTVVLGADKATAKRLKLRSTELGKRSGKGSTITVKLNAKARKALRTTRSVKVKVAIIATSTDGRVGTSSTTVTVKK
jgi:hypothetical protein